MKRTILMVVGCCIVGMFVAIGVQAKKQQEQTDLLSFQQTKAWNKIGLRLQQAWIDAVKAGDMDQTFECFASVRAPYSSGDRSFLQSKGYNVRLASGTIVRGNVAAKNLQQVAELYFVKTIKLSSPPGSQ